MTQFMEKSLFRELFVVVFKSAADTRINRNIFIKFGVMDSSMLYFAYPLSSRPEQLSGIDDGKISDIKSNLNYVSAGMLFRFFLCGKYGEALLMME